jgi:Na+/proline symporter
MSCGCMLLIIGALCLAGSLCIILFEGNLKKGLPGVGIAIGMFVLAYLLEEGFNKLASRKKD